MAKTTGLPSGTPTRVSGIYEQVGPRGRRTGQQADSTEGHPLPPTMGPGYKWVLKKAAHHKGDK